MLNPPSLQRERHLLLTSGTGSCDLCDGRRGCGIDYVVSRSGDEWSDLGCGSVVDVGSEISRAAIRKRLCQPSSSNRHGRGGENGRK
jgi:hypothetical protein